MHHTSPVFDGVPLPDDLLDVMRRMLTTAPELRITVAQLTGHPFFTTRVPLQWSVWVWKENKLEERAALVARLNIHFEGQHGEGRSPIPKCS